MKQKRHSLQQPLLGETECIADERSLRSEPREFETAYMPHNGYMDILVSGQGCAYMKKKFKQYAKDRGIEQNIVTKFNHKANGQLERVIRAVHDTIIKLANGKFEHWHEVLTIVVLNIWTGPHSITGISLAMALYGR